MSTIETTHFQTALTMLMNATFEHDPGIYLDKGSSFYDTLAEISAEEASIPVGGKCATLAAQVKHTAFYLDVLEEGVRTQKFPQVDWEVIWREVTAVSSDEWEAIKAELRESHQRILKLIEDTTEWPSDREIGGAIALIAHTAYHLGEIRQAMCIIKD